MPSLPLSPKEPVVPVEFHRLEAKLLQKAERARGLCPDCGGGLLRHGTISMGANGLQFTEQRARCPKCKVWWERKTTFDREDLIYSTDPRPIEKRLNPIPGEARQ